MPGGPSQTGPSENLCFNFTTDPYQMTMDESAILAACEKKKEYILSNLEYVRRVCVRLICNLPGLVELHFKFLAGSRSRNAVSCVDMRTMIYTTRLIRLSTPGMRRNVTMKALRQEIETDLGLEKNALREQKTVITAFVDRLLAAARSADKTPSKKGRSPAAKKVPAAKKGGTGARGQAKDPKRPKKALTAFMFFSNAKREQVKQDHPEIAKSVTDISRKLGELWKAASDADKAPYHEMAAEDKKRYAKDMESYQPPEDTAPAPKPAKGAKGAPTGGGANKYSAKAEKLRKICKQASIKVPIQLYTKYKQDGDVHELESGILALLEKQGLSAKSTKDEIEAARERLQLVQDLEGIDTSNIIKSPEGGGRRSRRRAAVAAVANMSQLSGSDETDVEDEGDDEDEKDGTEVDDDVAPGKARSAGGEEADAADAADAGGDDEEDEDNEASESSVASMTDSEFNGDDSSLEDEDASPAPRKRSRHAEQAEPAEPAERGEDVDRNEEAFLNFLVEQEVGDTKVESPQVEKSAGDVLQSREKKVKPEDKASQAAVVKMADWSDDHE